MKQLSVLTADEILTTDWPDEEPEVAIYVLIDPRTKERRYVGRSKNPEQRLQQHASNPSPGLMTYWIVDLLIDRLEPEMLILEWVFFPNSPWEREKYWICRGIEENWPLLNKQGHPMGRYYAWEHERPSLTTRYFSNGV